MHEATTTPEHHRRPAYFVQSPSRDSHDGEKTTTSFYSTPAQVSPTGSPPHSRSSVGRHSRESSTSRPFSGSLKPGPRKVSSNEVGPGEQVKGGHWNNNWNEEYDTAIEEEGLLEDEESRKGWPLRYYFLAFAVGFFLLFSLFALILYGASKPQKPRVAMKSIKIDRFRVHAGSDATGVSTDMISVNATVKFSFRNTATFFGVHVSSTPVALSYSQLTIGSGNMKKFHQSRKGSKNLTVVVIGDMIPMYGNAAGLSTPKGLTTYPIPLRLFFTVRSRAYVLGKLVKPRFNNEIECSIIFEGKKLNVTIPLHNNCTYVR